MLKFKRTPKKTPAVPEKELASEGKTMLGDKLKYRNIIKSVAKDTDLPPSQVKEITDSFLDHFIDGIVNGNGVALGERGTFKKKSQNQWVVSLRYVISNTED